jgi:hypothetical protein
MQQHVYLHFGIINDTVEDKRGNKLYDPIIFNLNTNKHTEAVIELLVGFVPSKIALSLLSVVEFLLYAVDAT